METTSQPPLHESLRTEFDLIQRKIDNIGEFKNRVRGWSLTLQTAIIAALFSGKLSEAVSSHVFFALGIPAVGVIFLFHFLDQQQEGYSRALGRRAFAIEKALDQLVVERNWATKKKQTMLKLALDEIQGTPRIAATMHLAARHGIGAIFKSMLPIRTNFFYYFEYLLTLFALGTLYFLRPASESTTIAAPLPAITNLYQVNIDKSQQSVDSRQQVQRREEEMVNKTGKTSR